MCPGVGIVPGPGGYRGASGHFAEVVRRLPGVEGDPAGRKRALTSTRSWLTRFPEAGRTAWHDLQSHPEFDSWLDTAIQMFWIHHFRMNGSLVTPLLIPAVAHILGCDVKTVRAVEEKSRNEATIQEWLGASPDSEPRLLARQAYAAASLLRGRYHEYFADAEGLHLHRHPHRAGISRSRPIAARASINNSEDYFARIILGSALTETNGERRVARWVDNLVRARTAIAHAAVALPHTVRLADAEAHAIHAAKVCELPTSADRVARALDIGSALVLGGVAVAIHPWAGPLGPAAVAWYRHRRGSSLGSDASKALLDTRWRFKRLARSQPGRIDLAAPEPTQLLGDGAS